MTKHTSDHRKLSNVQAQLTVTMEKCQMAKYLVTMNNHGQVTDGKSVNHEHRNKSESKAQFTVTKDKGQKAKKQLTVTINNHEQL